jgi:hypothetical protein
MWHDFVLKTVGKLLQDCSFNTLLKVYDVVLELDEAQKKCLGYEYGTKILLEMIQQEYEYRTPCDECRESIDLDTTPRF